jgi:hypothetical protein
MKHVAFATCRQLISERLKCGTAKDREDRRKSGLYVKCRYQIGDPAGVPHGESVCYPGISGRGFRSNSPAIKFASGVLTAR